MPNPQNHQLNQSSLFHNLATNPYLLLVLATIFWGGNITAGKLAVGHVDPSMLIIGRWAGALLILAPIAWPHVRRDWQKLKPGLPLLAMFGALGFTGFNILMYNSSLHTSAINGSMEQASIPVFVLLGNLIIFGVRPRLLQIIGLSITIIGVIWVATAGEPVRILSLSVNIGDAMVILACVFYAGYSLALRFKPKVHWLSFLAVCAFFALITALLSQLFISGGLSKFLELLPQITLRGWLLIAYVMLFPSILAQLFYARGVEIIGANRASIFINLLPLTGTLLSVLLVGETFQNYHLIAAILVICGIVLAESSIHKTG
ncbi:MAG TPA: DMT family transporter [Devosia sp.]|nr:DMT family transporter [Devosia sp.]